MLQFVVEYYLDVVTFCLALLAATAFIEFRLRHKHEAPGLSGACRLLLALLLIAAGGFAWYSGERERTRLRRMLEGYAPTYAAEMARQGHAQLSSDCALDHPGYLKLIEIQKQWLATNPAIADIYSLRRNAGGEHILLVDSETDYDHSGTIDAERERRTDVGEVLDADFDLIHEAFDGRQVFADQPGRDRWGYWVSAYAPIYDENGEVEAVLGVDYAASDWLARILRVRIAALGMAGVVTVTLLAASSVTTLARSEAQRRGLAERLARASESRLREIIDAEPQSVLVIGSDGRVLESNPAALAVVEVDDADQLRNVDLTATIDPEFRRSYLDLHRRTLAGEGGRLRFSFRSLKGRRRWMEKVSVPLRDDTGRVYAALSIGRDITSQRDAEEERQRLQALLVEQLRREAMEDKLTGLANRTLFTERLSDTINRTARDDAHHFAVLFLDFDGFKLVNDSLGHEIGDLLLIAIARRLRGALAMAETPAAEDERVEESLIARLGGDEFIILLDRLPHASQAERTAAILQNALAQPYFLNGYTVHTSASIGITSSDIRYRTAGEAIRDADTAMYRAKSDGKGKCVVFDQAMHLEAQRRLMLEHELGQAVDRQELYLEYQPIVSLENGRAMGVEALVRWRRADGELIMPREFITLAEENGQIGIIGAWVMRAACEQYAYWRAHHPEMASLCMSINLSRRQLTPELPAQVSRVLAETGLPPRQLILEIAESTMMQHAAASDQTLRQLRSMGIRLHMDDFGTGYSSLSCLHRFPLDAVKIDRGFINNVSERRDYAAVVNSIISLAHNLDIELIAEGVEGAEQVAMLQALGCDHAQGHYFTPALAAESVPAFLLQAPRHQAA